MSVKETKAAKETSLWDSAVGAAKELVHDVLGTDAKPAKSGPSSKYAKKNKTILDDPQVASLAGKIWQDVKSLNFSKAVDHTKELAANKTVQKTVAKAAVFAANPGATVAATLAKSAATLVTPAVEKGDVKAVVKSTSKPVSVSKTGKAAPKAAPKAPVQPAVVKAPAKSVAVAQPVPVAQATVKPLVEPAPAPVSDAAPENLSPVVAQEGKQPAAQPVALKAAEASNTENTASVETVTENKSTQAAPKAAVVAASAASETTTVSAGNSSANPVFASGAEAYHLSAVVYVAQPIVSAGVAGETVAASSSAISTLGSDVAVNGYSQPAIATVAAHPELVAAQPEAHRSALVVTGSGLKEVQIANGVVDGASDPVVAPKTQRRGTSVARASVSDADVVAQAYADSSEKARAAEIDPVAVGAGQSAGAQAAQVAHQESALATQRNVASVAEGFAHELNTVSASGEKGGDSRDDGSHSRAANRIAMSEVADAEVIEEAIPDEVIEAVINGANQNSVSV